MNAQTHRNFLPLRAGDVANVKGHDKAWPVAAVSRVQAVLYVAGCFKVYDLDTVERSSDELIASCPGVYRVVAATIWANPNA